MSRRSPSRGVKQIEEKSRSNPVLWPRVMVLVALCCGAAVLVLTDVVHAPLLRLLALTRHMIDAQPILGAALFVGFAALSGMLAFFSSAVLAPVAVHAWGPVLTTVLLWAGWVMGGAGSYAIGRTVGRPVAGVMSQAKLATYERKITRDTPLALVILFQLATPSEVPGYLLGMVRYSFPRYILVVAIAEIPYAIGTVIMGTSFLERRILPLLLLVTAAVGFSTWTFRRLRREL